MNDIEFVNTDTDTIKASVITAYEGLSGRTLAAGDPIRLFLESVASIIAQQRAIINFTGKMNLLAYSEGDYLDHIGVLVGCVRLAPEKAKAEALVTLSAEQDFAVTVPAGTRITAGDDLMFAVTETTIIPAGETTASVTVECTTAGEIGNGFVAGQLKQIVDPIAYVASIVNTSTSAGGADTEKDDAYRERIRVAPESFSVAGPTGAYIYWAKTASSLIKDVAVISPTPGYVEIYPLLEGGELPTQTILDDVAAICNSDSIRPLTDHVSVLAPTAVSYDVTATYYIEAENAGASAEIQAAVASAVDEFVLWQKSKLGRDVNPSELIRRIVDAGAKRVTVTDPAFTPVAADEVAIEGTVSVAFGGVDT